jgi:hypothetical protein
MAVTTLAYSAAVPITSMWSFIVLVPGCEYLVFALSTNVRLGCNKLIVTNALTYSIVLSITCVKSL